MDYLHLCIHVIVHAAQASQDKPKRPAAFCSCRGEDELLEREAAHSEEESPEGWGVCHCEDKARPDHGEDNGEVYDPGS